MATKYKHTMDVCFQFTSDSEIACDTPVADRIAASLADKIGSCNKHQIAIGYAKGLLNQHRTHQQNQVSALIEGILAYAKESKANDFIDLRNKHVVESVLKHEAALCEIAQAPFI